MLPACRSLFLWTLQPSVATTSTLAQDLRHQLAVLPGWGTAQEFRDFKYMHNSSQSTHMAVSLVRMCTTGWWHVIRDGLQTVLGKTPHLTVSNNIILKFHHHKLYSNDDETLI